jgi:hypothetical protein
MLLFSDLRGLLSFLRAVECKKVLESSAVALAICWHEVVTFFLAGLN